MAQTRSHNNLTNNPNRYALRSAWLGGIIWVVTLLWWQPSPFSTPWASALLLLAPLVLVPLTLRLVEPDGTWIVLRAVWRMAVMLQLPAAILLVPSSLLSQGGIAAALALPWLITTTLIAFTGVLRIWLQGWRSAEETAISIGLIYIVVGGGWVLLDRFGARPLNFEAVIVLLTAIHFHYAGFLLPIFTGWVGQILKGVMVKVAALGVTLGVPLVALGITASQLGFNPLMEASAAWFTALAGLLAASLHIRLALKNFEVTPSSIPSASSSVPKRATAILWAICGLALTFSMIQAALYGARFYIVLEWLALPWMRALHGTANALGFGFAGVLAWSMAKRSLTKLKN